MRRLSSLMVRVTLVLFVCLAMARPASAEETLFRLFLRDGSSLVSVGEMARVNDQVVFSMPVGGTATDPRLHAVALASDLVDWPRTDRHATSARFLNYVATRAEADYGRMTGAVAAVLNQIAQSTDRTRALALAEQARRTLADWPRTHFGYRQDDVRDIVTLLDQAISRLRGAGTIELSLFATIQPIPVEPLAAMPTPREQLDQLLTVLTLTETGRDRVALLQSGLALLAEAGGVIGGTATVRKSLEKQLRDELAIDARYAQLSERVLAQAVRSAAAARVSDIERALSRLTREDARLGHRRPEVILAVRNAVNQQLDAARRLRLLRDQWEVRQDLYRAYQRSVGTSMVQFVKAQPSLEAIRRVEGPPPNDLWRLRSHMAGGADRLDRMPVPDYLRPTHALLIEAWRFAEAAVQGRYEAVTSGSLPTAWEASSAAAGALLMFSRAQQELRALLEPPKLQ